MGYYLAPSLAKLRAEADARYPNRDRSSDGWIGDAAHAARKSDHNPDWSAGGVVRAYDLDEDLDGNKEDHGAELMFLAEHIRRNRDPRVKYVIYEGMMFSSYSTATRKAWEWGPYTGVNAHRKHMHVSILATRAAENDTRPWFPTVEAKPPIPPAPKEDDDDMRFPVIRVANDPKRTKWLALTPEGAVPVPSMEYYEVGVGVGLFAPVKVVNARQYDVARDMANRIDPEAADPHAIFTWYAAAKDSPLHTIIRDVVNAVLAEKESK